MQRAADGRHRVIWHGLARRPRGPGGPAVGGIIVAAASWQPVDQVSHGVFTWREKEKKMQICKISFPKFDKETNFVILFKFLIINGSMILWRPLFIF